MKNLFTILCSTTLLVLPSLVYAKCCPPGSVALCKGECCTQACNSNGECPSLCPNGGTKIGDECCKDGKALDSESGEYKYYLPDCGCPDGGHASAGGSIFCCKDGKVMNQATGKYEKDFAACKCSNGEELVKTGKKYGLSDQLMCCPVGNVWIDEP